MEERVVTRSQASATIKKKRVFKRKNSDFITNAEALKKITRTLNEKSEEVEPEEVSEYTQPKKKRRRKRNSKKKRSNVAISLIFVMKFIIIKFPI